MNKYNFKATITGFMAGKPGEPRVKMHTFPANDHGPARQVAQVTLKVMTGKEPLFIRVSFPASQVKYLESAAETALVSAEGWIAVSAGKDGKQWWNLEGARIVGVLQSDGSTKFEKPTKGKPAKAKPAPVEDEEDEDADDEAAARTADDDEEDF